MVFLEYNNRFYIECKGKRRRNLCFCGVCNLDEEGKLGIVLLENYFSDKSYGFG